jgi:hypothetical protein
LLLESAASEETCALESALADEEKFILLPKRANDGFSDCIRYTNYFIIFYIKKYHPSHYYK